jgi:hypothetical protein
MNESTRVWRGITIGGGSSWCQIVEETGLDDIIVRSATRTVPRGAGGIPGPHFQDLKTIVAKLWVYGSSPAEAEQRVALLRQAMTPSQDTFPLYLKHQGDVDKFVRARPVRFSQPRSVWSETLAVFEVTAIWEVADPRVYGITPESLLVGAFSDELVGINLPDDQLPWNMAPAPQSFSDAFHSGTGLAYPVIQVQFPAGGSGDHTGFQLSNLTTGVSIVSDAVLTPGQTLTADMDAYVRYTGELIFSVDGSSRIGNWIRPRFEFYLQPGSNVIKFEPVGTATVVCRLTWLPTY